MGGRTTLKALELLNVHTLSEVRIAEPLVPDPSPFDVEIAIANIIL
jgi:hypothetical protein